MVQSWGLFQDSVPGVSGPYQWEVRKPQILWQVPQSNGYPEPMCHHEERILCPLPWSTGRKGPPRVHWPPQNLLAKRNTVGGRVIRPMVSPCGPPSSHKTPYLACSWPHTTFFDISESKVKVGFFWRKVQVPRRTYMQIFNLYQASGV